MINVIDYIKQYNSEHPEFTYKNSLSVSKCIGYLKNPFDSEKVANEMYKKYFNEEGNKYYQMTPEMILESWEAKRKFSLDRGKLFDTYVEHVLDIKDPVLFKKWKIIEDIDNNDFMKRAMNGFIKILTYLKECGYDTIIGTEIPLWITNNNLIVNGRCDCLLYSSKYQKYLVIDWKTNEQIKTTDFKNLKGPLNHLKDCDLYVYSTQVYFYKKALAETYKLADFNHIDVMVCQMGVNEDPYYKIWLPEKFNFTFDTELMNKVIKYCFDVHNIS